LCRSIFKHGAEILKGLRPAADNAEETSRHNAAAKQKDYSSKKTTKNMKQQESVNSCTQNTLESKN